MTIIQNKYYYIIDYESIQGVLMLFVYEHELLDHKTKIKAMNYLILDKHKNQIMEHITSKTTLETIK